jgi:hypothetical protein
MGAVSLVGAGVAAIWTVVALRIGRSFEDGPAEAEPGAPLNLQASLQSGT